MLAPPLFPSPERRAFLSSLACSWEHITVPWRVRRNPANWICLETCTKIPVEIMLPKRHLPWSFQAPFEEEPLGNKPDVLSSHHHSFSSLLHDIWESSLGRILEHAEERHIWLFERGMEAVMCVPWFLLLELSGVPVCDSPAAFGKGKEIKIVPAITTGQVWNVPHSLLPELDQSPLVTQLLN